MTRTVDAISNVIRKRVIESGSSSFTVNERELVLALLPNYVDDEQLLEAAKPVFSIATNLRAWREAQQAISGWLKGWEPRERLLTTIEEITRTATKDLENAVVALVRNGGGDCGTFAGDDDEDLIDIARAAAAAVR